RRLLRGHNQY
nr:Chain C, peptide s10R [synthetic construct]